ncbi:MAG: filamentous hemagglutinin N-terminal domain-containing protein [Nitrospira sp.]|nr:filamentous hemagglutinin N-terminal domain-containing protein [Nitrospira sp.]
MDHHSSPSARAATSLTPTPGPAGLGTQVLPPSGGNTYGIRGGTTVGTNLFHSFGQFSVATGDIAQFQTSNLLPNGAMSNILSRVTGGNPSAIFGTIDSATFYPGANLFLMNPAGVLFGPTATLNIGGMATFTTADYLRLVEVDGVSGIFHANPATTSVLTTAPVASFGFLGSNPAAIAIQGSQLAVATGTGLSLVGGKTGFTFTDPDTGLTASAPDGVTMTGGSLSAPSGQINLVSVASAGEISTVDFLPDPSMAMGPISLSQGAVVDVSGDGGGTVRIRGGRFVMDQGAILIAHTTGANDGAPTAISINVTDEVSLNHQSGLFAWARGAGRSGNIEVTGRTIEIADGSLVYTNSTDAGTPGNITVTATDTVSVRGADELGNPSEILSDSLGLASTGSITLRAPVINLLDMGAVETRMFGFGEGVRAGDITIEATNLNLLSGGKINIVSGSGAPTGNIAITATDSITLVGTNDFGTTSFITNENTSGGTGTITIHTGSLTLSDQARINSTTFLDSDPAAANTPKIAITADSSIALSSGSRIDIGGSISDTGRLELSTQNLTMSGTSSITTLSNANGASGPIVMNVQNLTVSEGSQIVSSSALGLGRGGDITVNATASVVVTGQGTDPFGGTLTSGIFSNTISGLDDPTFAGNAGNIAVTAHSIEVSSGARIDSSSQLLAYGNAGTIDLRAPTINVNGGIISTSTEFAGQAGSISLHADAVTVNNGGQLTSSSVVRQTPIFEGEIIPPPTGNAGNITIQGVASPAQSVVIDGTGSGLFTNTQGSGAGGNIFVNGNSVMLSNEGALSATTSGSGNAGNITVVSDTVSLTNFATISASTSGEGAGGSIHISAQNTISAVDSFINASANSVQPGAGSGGHVLLSAPTINVAGGDISTLTIGPGNAGDISFQAGQFTLSATEGAPGQVEASTSGPGHGGSISVLGLTGPGSQASDVTLSGLSSLRSETQTLTGGTAGNIGIETVRLSLTEGSAITTAALNSPGNAGNVTLNATDSFLVSGSRVTSDVLFGSSGNGGQITVTTPSLTVTQGPNGFGGVIAGVISTSTGSSGNAGSVTINTNNLTLADGGRITSSSFLDDPIFPPATGAAGTVVVQGLNGPGTQANLIAIAGQDSSGQSSGIFTTTQGIGAAGDITVYAQSVTLQNNAQISSSSTGTGIAGNIAITANQIFTAVNSSVTTEANNSSGGIIKITTNPNGTVELSNSTISASVLDGTGGGGSVNIDPQFVILQNSQILAQAVQGPGGNINITITNGGLFLPDATSVVSASSQFGQQGTVTIQAPIAPAGGKIQPLGKAPLQVTALLSQRCAAIARGEVSSFVVAGRDTLPTEPGGWLTSPLALGSSEAGSAMQAGNRGLPSESSDPTIVSLRRLPSAWAVAAQLVEDDWVAGCGS